MSDDPDEPEHGGLYEDWNGLGPAAPPPAGGMYGHLTLALLEEMAAVLIRHGYPPLRGYALAELTTSLYRLGQLRD